MIQSVYSSFKALGPVSFPSLHLHPCPCPKVRIRVSGLEAPANLHMLHLFMASPSASCSWRQALPVVLPPCDVHLSPHTPLWQPRAWRCLRPKPRRFSHLFGPGPWASAHRCSREPQKTCQRTGQWKHCLHIYVCVCVCVRVCPLARKATVGLGLRQVSVFVADVSGNRRAVKPDDLRLQGLDFSSRRVKALYTVCVCSSRHMCVCVWDELT